MNEIKYRKGDIVKEVWSDGFYLFEIIRDIPLKLWKDEDSYIDMEYVRCIRSRATLLGRSMENEYNVNIDNIKQYKVNYMNTALYKVLHGDKYEQI